jgi:hypothetical protein
LTIIAQYCINCDEISTYVTNIALFFIITLHVIKKHCALDEA